MAITTALKKIKAVVEEPTTFKVIQGGMSAGKTYAILTILVAYAQTYPESVVTVLGLSYGHLRDGAIRDFRNILREVGLWDESAWNKTATTYTFANGSLIEFRSVDKMGAHGPRRDVLFVNEANGISWDVFDQLASRTRDFSIIDYNPSSKFWAHEQLVEGQPDETTFLRLTYLDNEALSDREVANIELHRPKPGEEPSNWWVVYGLGEIGSLEGNVYSGWQESTAEEIAKAGHLVRYGLDFGFANDQTALVALYELPEGKLGAIEMLYKTGMLNSQYDPEFRALGVDPSVLIVADSARPEAIAEIKLGGFRVLGTTKGPGSVLRGINAVKEHQIVFAGENLKREYLSYAWRKKASGETLDEPRDGNDHLMDALRYAVDDLGRFKFDF